MRSLSENDTDTDGGPGTLYMTAEVQQHMNELKQDQKENTTHATVYKKVP